MDILKIWRLGLDILLPALCIKCRSRLKDDEKSHLLCRICFDSIAVNRVVTRPDKDTALYAVGRYDDMALRELIHAFKYDKFMNGRNTIRALIKRYIAVVNLVSIVGSDAILIPIPLHRARLRKRGFNQSEIIASELSRLTGLAMDSDILHRVKNTKTQIHLENYEKRRENLKNSFEVTLASSTQLKSYSTITLILVDDVYTSGATMKEAIRALKRVGAKNVVGFVLAKA